MANNKFFVVPNNDLEAGTIIEMLKNTGYVEGKDFLVTNQGGNANYDKLEPNIKFEMACAKLNGKEVYTVEIAGTPEKYNIIDHHGDLSDRPSSLEQVSELIGNKLTFRQELIAKDDVGGMLNMIDYCEKEYHLSKENALDYALGIREDGYKYTMSEKAIAISKTAEVYEWKDSNVTVVNLETTKTSYVADKLINAEKDGLLIISNYLFEFRRDLVNYKEYLNSEINFYGPKEKIELLPNKLGLEKGEYWTVGNGEFEGVKIGFFGTTKFKDLDAHEVDKKFEEVFKEIDKELAEKKLEAENEKQDDSKFENELDDVDFDYGEK